MLWHRLSNLTLTHSR